MDSSAINTTAAASAVSTNPTPTPASTNPPSKTMTFEAGEAKMRYATRKIEEKAGETIPMDGAGLIVAYKHDHANTIEPAVTRAVKKVVGAAEGRHVEALTGTLADAQ